MIESRSRVALESTQKRLKRRSQESVRDRFNTRSWIRQFLDGLSYRKVLVCRPRTVPNQGTLQNLGFGIKERPMTSDGSQETGRRERSVEYCTVTRSSFTRSVPLTVSLCFFRSRFVLRQKTLDYRFFYRVVKTV